MTIHSLDIPDSPADLGPFLEQAIASAWLPALVAELRAVIRESSNSTLQAALSTDRGRVLERGLAALDFERQRLLLANPELLLQLQELVYSEGGKYWLDLLKDPESQSAASRGWKSVAAQTVHTPSSRVHASPSQSRRKSLALMLTAAGVLIAGYLVWPKTRPWGWNRPGVFDVAMARRPYLEHLAETANEWFSTDARTSAELSTRLREFRSGCEKLLAASHPQLPQPDRDWLIERCKVWTSKIDQSLADLEARRKPPDAVSTDVKAMVNQLVGALQKRAEHMPTAASRMPVRQERPCPVSSRIASGAEAPILSEVAIDRLNSAELYIPA